MSAVFTRLVLGYVLALPFVAPWVARYTTGEQQYTFRLRMASTASGVLQVFYDVGSGYLEQHAGVLPLVVSDTPFEYRVPLLPATYRSIRIDPNFGMGIYTIERAEIVDVNGAARITIPLMELAAVRQLTVIEQTPDRFVVSAPGGSDDPLLVWTPSSPFTLWLEPSTTWRLLGRAALLWLLGTAAASALAWLLGRVWPARLRFAAWASAFGASNPAVAVVIAALLATLVATYPVVFAGRSYVSPANGGTGMLYDQAPYAPGSGQFEIEDTRGSDTGAMMWQSLAHSVVQRKALAEGEVPLWNRYTALGRPLWGQGLSYILDPLQWLTFLGDDPAPGWDLKFVAHRFVFAAGVGLASLVATGAWLPAGIAAAAAPFAGAFAYRFNHPAIFSLTYTPWALLGWFLLARATSVSAGARAAIVLTLGSALTLVAPTPKEGALALVSATATGALAVVLSAGSWPMRTRRLATAAAAGIALVLLTAPHWLVFLDTLRQSAHAYEVAYVNVGGMPNAVGLWVTPVMPGTPLPGLHLFAFMLVVVAASAPLRLRKDRASLASLIVATLMLSVAFGLVPTSWLSSVPLVSQLGHVFDVATLAALTPLLIVCAAGAQILCSGGAARTVVATMISGLTGWWLWLQMTQLGPLNRFEPWAVALLLPLAVAWPACMLAARRSSGVAAAASVAAMAALVLPGGLHLEYGSGPIDRLLLQPRSRPQLAQSSPAIDAVHAATSGPTRTTGIQQSLFAGTAVLYGLEDLRGADPLEVAAYRELIDATGMQRATYWLTWFETADVSRLDPILDMLNVGFLIGRFDFIPPADRVLPLTGPDLVRAIQRPTPWPRAFFVDGASSYTTPADLVQQVDARRAPFAAILESDAEATSATNGLPRATGRTVPADHYVLTPNTTSFRIRADREGVAVLGETYLPDDFIATLNGNDVPYFRVNHVFKAVRISGPGDWDVRFQYRPRRWSLALGAAGLGALILIALAAVAWRGRAQRQQTSATESVYA